MRTVQEIEERIESLEYDIRIDEVRINKHEFYIHDNVAKGRYFDIDSDQRAIKEYQHQIAVLRAQIKTLKWILGND